MKKRIMAAVLSALSAPAWSATDLMDAWQAARGHDPTYLAAKAGAQAGAQKREQGKALWRPTVSLQAGAGLVDMKNETDGATFSAPSMGTMNEARFITDIHQGTDARVGLTASVPLYSPERGANAKLLELQSDFADVQLKQADIGLLMRVAQSYFDVLNADDALKTLEVRKQAVQELLDIARENFRVGKYAATDVHEAQAAFDEILAEESVRQNDLDYKRTVFADLTGLSATNLAHPKEDANLGSLLPGDLKSVIERAQAANPEIQMRKVNREMTRSEIDKYRFAGSTRVALVAQYSQQRAGGQYQTSSASVSNRNAWLGIQVTIPLYTGGMQSSRLTESLALAEQASEEVDASQQVVVQRVRASYFALDTGLKQIRAYQQGLLSAAKKLDATQTGREIGARTTADVLNAQQTYFATQNNLLLSRNQVLMASFSLAAASGELNVDVLKKINTFLAP